MRVGPVWAVAGAAGLMLAAAPARHAARPAGAPSAADPAGGGGGLVADYWVSAATTSGFGAGMMGGAGGRPSIGAMMAMATGRGPSSSRTLDLELGSSQRPSGAPSADHFVPAGLGVGPSLPLITPERTSSRTEPMRGSPESYQRPQGRVLIYWGCGDHAGPGQPAVFDFSTVGAGAPMPDLAGAVRVAAERPPGADRFATFGTWPNGQISAQVPAGGSLVGAHAVRGDYSPEITFQVGPALDFMPALGLAEAGATPGGGQRLTWRAPPTATGYHLMLIGAQESDGAAGGRRGRRGGGGGSGDDVTMVFWSSSAVKPGFFGGGLADYLPPGEVARLVREGAVLPPSTTQCTVPSEVVRAAPSGMVSGIAYGPEQTWTDPTRPRGPRWRAKLRVKSTASLVLGMGDMGGDEDAPRRPRDGGDGQPQPPTTSGDRARDLLRKFRPF